MKRSLTLLPFALFLIILPFPGTVAARLLLLAICFGIALWQWQQVPGARAPLPCKPALGAWIAVCLASLAYAFDPAYTLGELKNELGYTMMAFFAFFVVARDREAALFMLRVQILGLFFIGGWATVSWASHDFVWQEGGQHGGVGIFSTYLITLVPVLVWLIFEEEMRDWRSLAAFALTFAFFLAVISLQRIVWPVFAAQITILVILLARRNYLRRRRARLITLLACAVFLAGLLWGNHQRNPVAAERSIASTNLHDTRFLFWPGVVARIAAHPVNGAGFGRGVMSKAYPDLVPAYNTWLLHPHNVFLNYGIGMGIPGILALLALFACFGSVFWRAAAGPSALAGIVGLSLVAGVLLRNQFNDFFARDMSLMFWALTGLFARLALTSKRDAA